MKAIFLAFSAVLVVATFHIAAAKAQIIIHPPGVELGEHHRYHEHEWHPYRYSDHDRDEWRHHRHHHHDDDDEE